MKKVSLLVFVYKLFLGDYACVGPFQGTCPHMFRMSMPKQFESEQKLHFTKCNFGINFLFTIKQASYFTDLINRGSLEGATSCHACGLLACCLVTFL
jgi:hypothetical protein